MTPVNTCPHTELVMRLRQVVEGDGSRGGSMVERVGSLEASMEYLRHWQQVVQPGIETLTATVTRIAIIDEERARALLAKDKERKKAQDWLKILIALAALFVSAIPILYDQAKIHHWFN